MPQLKITDLFTPSPRPARRINETPIARSSSSAKSTTFGNAPTRGLQTPTTPASTPARRPPRAPEVATPATVAGTLDQTASLQRTPTSSNDKHEIVPETPRKQQPRPTLPSPATSTPFSDPIEVSSGIDDSDCEIQKVLPSPNWRARRTVKKVGAAKGTGQTKRSTQRWRAARRSTKAAPGSNEDESDCEIVRVQPSPRRKMQRKPKDIGESSDCEIVKVVASPKRRHGTNNRQLLQSAQSKQATKQQPLKKKPNSPAVVKKEVKKEAKTPATPKRECPGSNGGGAVTEKTVLHLDLTDLPSSDESDFSLDKPDRTNSPTNPEQTCLEPEIATASAIPQPRRPNKQTLIATIPARGFSQPSMFETQHGGVDVQGSTSSGEDEICDGYEDKTEPVDETRPDIKMEAMERDSTSDASWSPCPYFESASEDDMEPSSYPSPPEEPMSSCDANETLVERQDSPDSTGASSGSSDSFRSALETLERSSSPSPADAIPVPYSLQPAYDGGILASMWRDGVAGMFEPHHRDVIVGLKSILKRPSMLPALGTMENKLSRPKENSDMAYDGVKDRVSPQSSGKKSQVRRAEGGHLAHGASVNTATVQRDGMGLEKEWSKTRNYVADDPPDACEVWQRTRQPCMIHLVRDGVSEHAIKPTVERLRQRIAAGEAFPGINSAATKQWKSEWEPPRPRPPRGGRAMAAELEYRGIKTGTQYGNFWHNLMTEYSRLAGSPVPLFTMMKKAFDDFQQECMEIRRDLEPREVKEEKPLEGLEALLLWGAGDTDEESVSSSEDEMPSPKITGSEAISSDDTEAKAETSDKQPPESGLITPGASQLSHDDGPRICGGRSQTFKLRPGASTGKKRVLSGRGNGGSNNRNGALKRRKIKEAPRTAQTVSWTEMKLMRKMRRQ